MKKGGEKIMWKAFTLLICIIFVLPAIVTAVASSKSDIKTADNDDVKIERIQEVRYGGHHGGYHGGHYRPGPYHYYRYSHPYRWWACVPPPPPY